LDIELGEGNRDGPLQRAGRDDRGPVGRGVRQEKFFRQDLQN